MNYAHLDTSFTFNFDADAVLALSTDRGILTTGGTAGGSIDSGAQVTAMDGPVIVHGNVANDQRVVASSPLNSTKNMVQAVISSEMVSTTLTPAVTAGPNPQTIQVASTNGITVGMQMFVNMGKADQELVTITAVGNGTITAIFTKNHSATATLILQNTKVASSTDDVQVTATNTSNVIFEGLLPSYDSTLALKTSSSAMASTVDAHISGGATVTANKDIQVLSTDKGSIFVVAIALTLKTSGSFAVGICMVDNDVGDTVEAYTETSFLTANNGTVTINATSIQNIQSIAIGVALQTGGKFSGSGSYISTNVHNTISAYMDGGTINAEYLAIYAGDTDGSTQTTILSISGNISLTLGNFALGAAISDNTVANVVSAKIDGGIVNTTQDTSVTSVTNPEVTATAVGAGAAVKIAGQASLTYDTISGGTTAAIDSAANVITSGGVTISAINTPSLFLLAGGLAYGATAGVGASAGLLNDTGVVDASVGRIPASPPKPPRA